MALGCTCICMCFSTLLRYKFGDDCVNMGPLYKGGKGRDRKNVKVQFLSEVYVYLAQINVNKNKVVI